MANTLSDNAIRELKNLRSVIRREILAALGGGKENTNNTSRLVRVGKTTSLNYTYPTDGNRFEVRLGSLEFDSTGVGENDLVFTPYEPESESVRLCFSLFGNYYPEDTIVPLMLIHSKWYIFDQSFGRIFKTPASGIPGMVGETLGFATCDSYVIQNGVLARRKNEDGSDKSETVYHIAPSAVSGTTYIQAKKIDGVWVADMEACS